MRYEWGQYAFDEAVTVRCPPTEVLNWLVTPDRMSRWIAGLDSVTLLDARPDVVGARTRLDFGGGRLSPGTFRGEVVEWGDGILVRLYRPGFDPEGYERTVRYDVHAIGTATEVRCTVSTRVLCPPRTLRGLPTRRERLHLRRCLERLRSLSEGKGPLTLLRRFHDSGLQPQPL